MPPHVPHAVPPAPATNAPPTSAIPLLWQQDGPGPGEARTYRRHRRRGIHPATPFTYTAA